MCLNPVPQRFLQLEYWGLADGAAEDAPTSGRPQVSARIANTKEE